MEDWKPIVTKFVRKHYAPGPVSVHHKPPFTVQQFPKENYPTVKWYGKPLIKVIRFLTKFL